MTRRILAALAALALLAWAVLRRPKATAELLGWAESELRASEDIAAGRVRRFTSAAEATAWLLANEPDDGLQPPDPGLPMRLRGEA